MRGPGEKPLIPSARDHRAATSDEDQHCSGEPAAASIFAPVSVNIIFLLEEGEIIN